MLLSEKVFRFLNFTVMYTSIKMTNVICYSGIQETLESNESVLLFVFCNIKQMLKMYIKNIVRNKCKQFYKVLQLFL